MILIGMIVSLVSVAADSNPEPYTKTTGFYSLQSPPCLSDADLFRYYDRAHTTLLMATRMIYGYILNPDNLDKIAFHDRISLSEEAVSKISDACPVAANQRKNLAGLNRVFEKYDNMSRSAGMVFSSPGLNRSDTNRTISGFGTAVDESSTALYGLWLSCSANGTMNHDYEFDEEELYGQVFSSVVDAYAYLVLNDTERKNASLEKFAALDEKLDKCQREHPQWSCRELEEGKNSIETEVKAIFDRYEKEGMIDTGSVQTLDYDISKMEKRYLFLTA